MKKNQTRSKAGKMLIKTGIALIIFFGSLFSAFAQGDGPRFYLKTLMGMNAVPVLGSSMSGNANPLDPSHQVQPGAYFNATMAMAGYARMFPLFNRASMVSVILPMGRVSSTTSLNGQVTNQNAMGFGDPMLMFDINVIGPKAIRGIPDLLRYKPRFSMDIIGSIAIPIGNYNSQCPVNLGQNRWYGRIGLPMICQIGKWVPGKRTTIEFLPAVWFFSANPDFVGQRLESKPLLQCEGHITRDFMEKFWGSLNVIWYYGSEGTITTSDTVKTSGGLNNLGIGGTLGYQINDNIQLSLTYATLINDSQTDDLNMNTFRISMVIAWHKLIEGMHRLKSE
jgi:hypothetical protein